MVFLVCVGILQAEKRLPDVKLNRMDSLRDTGGKFDKRQLPDCDWSPRRIYPASIHVKVRCASGMKWRLIEEYGVECFTEQGGWIPAV